MPHSMHKDLDSAAILSSTNIQNECSSCTSRIMSKSAAMKFIDWQYPTAGLYLTSQTRPPSTAQYRVSSTSWAAVAKLTVCALRCASARLTASVADQIANADDDATARAMHIW